MKKYLCVTILLLAFASAIFAGCINGIDYSLPENPVEFTTYDYLNPSDPEDGYLVFDYNGRTYVPYGTIGTPITGRDVGKCLGYIVQDGEKREDDRVFPLTADGKLNYLVVITYRGFMDQPVFYRAADTVGKDIATPAFVKDLDYGFWR